MMKGYLILLKKIFGQASKFKTPIKWCTVQKVRLQNEKVSSHVFSNISETFQSRLKYTQNPDTSMPYPETCYTF